MQQEQLIGRDEASLLLNIMPEWWQGYKVHDTRTTVRVCNALCEVWHSRLHLDNDSQRQCHFIAWQMRCVFGGNTALRLQKSEMPSEGYLSKS